MYKVFYNQRTVLFTDKSEKNNIKSSSIKCIFKNKEELKKEIDLFLENNTANCLEVYSKNKEKAFEEFCSLYKIIEAAGGLVSNRNDEYLFIYRRNKWDLPKGKIEKGESSETGAIREVEEECGIKDIIIKKILDITYHTYKLGNEDILKRTYWYEMHYNGNNALTPQLEEEITEAIWLKKDEFKKVTENTFPSIIEVMQKANLLDL